MRQPAPDSPSLSRERTFFLWTTAAIVDQFTGRAVLGRAELSGVGHTVALVSRTCRRTIVVLILCAVLPSMTAASCDDEPSGVTLGEAGRGTVAEVVEASGAVTARAAATVT